MYPSHADCDTFASGRCEMYDDHLHARVEAGVTHAVHENSGQLGERGADPVCTAYVRHVHGLCVCERVVGRDGRPVSA